MKTQSAFKQYIYIVLLIVFSSFEYFFRQVELSLILCLIAIFEVIFFYKKRVYVNSIIIIFAFTILYLVQSLILKEYNINGLYGNLIWLYGAFAIGLITYDRFTEIFTKTIIFIATYSLLIYLLTFIPSIKSFLFEISANFPSLNVQNAVFTGGGANFIIYNLQTDFIEYTIGVSRNCGPFWEPGMFAYFISTALFFNLFILKLKNRTFASIILTLTLLTTFSTAGFVIGGVLLLLFNLNTKFSIWQLLIGLPIIITAIVILSDLEYVGGKITEQFNSATHGSDTSRFSALLTQIDMISNAPWFGGEKISDYTTTKTLASGILLPFVNYGIPAGLVLLFCYLKAYINMSLYYTKSIKYGIQFFIFILINSFSQTILLSLIIWVIMFAYLQLNSHYHVKEIKI